MKVLYISNKPIYPKVDGGCVAMDNFLQCLLHRNIKVKHLLIHTNKHPYIPENYPSELSKKIQPQGVFIDTNVSPKSALKHLFKQGSYNVARFYSEEMEQLIAEQLQADDYSAVILESLFVAPYLEIIRKNFDGKVFIRTHNVESDIWEDLAKSTRNFARASYMRKLAKDLRKYELEILQKFDGILALSSDDVLRFSEMQIKTKCTVIPVTVEPEEESTNTYENANFFHLGVMNWRPNIEAVERLIKLFPSIRKEIPVAELHIAGKYSQQEFQENKQDGVFVHGFVECSKSFSQGTGILVSPILSGSGIRIKILEAMALGIPCITTQRGAQGINHSQSKCIVVVESDAEIVQESIHLARDKKFREEIGKNARDYIRKNHNIESVSSEIVEFIERT